MGQTIHRGQYGFLHQAVNMLFNAVKWGIIIEKRMGADWELDLASSGTKRNCSFYLHFFLALEVAHVLQTESSGKYKFVRAHFFLPITCMTFSM